MVDRKILFKELGDALLKKIRKDPDNDTTVIMRRFVKGEYGELIFEALLEEK